MKIVTLMLFSLGLFAACKQEEKKVEDPGAISLRAEGKKLDLPYQLTRIPDWEMGDDNNIPIAMNVIKCYEAKDFVSLSNYLADTVIFSSAVGDFRGSKKEAVKFLKDLRDKRLEVTIEMNDYESVKSKTRNEEWVSLWYTETITDRTGKVDSAQVMDDYKIVKGKVALVDSKIRRMGAKQ